MRLIVASSWVEYYHAIQKIFFLLKSTGKQARAAPGRIGGVYPAPIHEGLRDVRMQRHEPIMM